MKTVTIDYAPRDYQTLVHESIARYKVIVFHRQAGKTTMAINELLKQATIKQGTYFYIAPTYRMAKQIAWDMLKHYLPKELTTKINESELLVELVNGSKIYLKGADNPDSLRGVTLTGVILDEYGMMKKEVWDAIIRPTTIVNQAWVLFIGTPNGKNHFFENYKRGERQETDWFSWKLTVDDTQMIPTDELERIKKETTQEFFNQEYLCEFLEGAGQIFRRIEENTKDTLKDPIAKHQYVLGVDLGKAMDFTVITTMDRMTHEVVYIERFNKIDWEFQASRIEAVVRKYNNAYMWIDSTGKGDPVADNLSRKGLSVRRFEYTNDKKKQLIENLILKFEYDKIKIPNDQNLREELEVFTYEVSPKTRMIMYNAPSGYHDDCVNSLALACWKLGEKLTLPRLWGPTLSDPSDAFTEIGVDTAYVPASSKTGY